MINKIIVTTPTQPLHNLNLNSCMEMALYTSPCKLSAQHLIDEKKPQQEQQQQYNVNMLFKMNDRFDHF